MEFKQWEQNVINDAVLFLCDEYIIAINGRTSSTTISAPSPNMDLHNLRTIVESIRYKEELQQIVDTITPNAIQSASNNLAAAHAKAASIRVTSPSQETIDGLKRDLEEISNEIRNDQRFKVALNLANSIAISLQNKMG